MEKFFKMAGDIDNDNTFQTHTDLNTSNNSRLIIASNMNTSNKNYFEFSGDLDSNNKSIEIKDDSISNVNNLDVQTYLYSIVSGIKYDSESELGTVCSEGNVIISLNELQKMVDSGEYNIISAMYFNDEMIEIKYQQFEKNISRKI